MRYRIYIEDWFVGCRRLEEYAARQKELADTIDRITGTGTWKWGLQRLNPRVPKCIYIDTAENLILLKLHGLFVEYPVVDCIADLTEYTR